MIIRSLLHHKTHASELKYVIPVMSVGYVIVLQHSKVCVAIDFINNFDLFF